MAGIRRTDNARPKSPRRRRNRLVKVNVPYLFSVRNMFFSKGYWSLSMVGGPFPWSLAPFED
jgi:hypothetical protein